MKNVYPLEKAIKGYKEDSVNCIYLLAKGEITPIEVGRKYEDAIKHIDKICKDRNRY